MYFTGETIEGGQASRAQFQLWDKGMEIDVFNASRNGISVTFSQNSVSTYWIMNGSSSKIMELVPNIPIRNSLATGDFNNLTTTGWYYTQGGMTANKPVSSALYGYILVLSFNAAMSVQVVFDSNNGVFSRAYSGATPTWKNWKTFL